MLRLVAGTEVKNVDRESFDLEMKTPVAAATATSSAQEDYARKLVLGYQIAGKTVRELIEASDVPADSSDRAARLASMTAFTTGCVTLCRLGIILASGGHDVGLTLDSYATVVDSKLLVRRIPELKKLNIDLAGLALY
jgi:hypothetical protein